MAEMGAQVHNDSRINNLVGATTRRRLTSAFARGIWSSQEWD